MTLYNVITTLVTLISLALAIKLIRYDSRATAEALQAMRDLIAEFARSETEEARQDNREERIRKLTTQLHARVDNHAGRLNALEDMVDLLNHDGTTPIPSDVEVTSEFLDACESDRMLNGVDLEATQSLPILADGWALRDIELHSQLLASIEAGHGIAFARHGEELLVGDGLEVEEIEGYSRAEFNVQVHDPALAPSLYAASVRELARHHLKFSLDHVL